MQVTITGSSGIIGSALVASLTADGHRVTRLVRRDPRGADEASWDPAAGVLDPDVLRGVDAVVHLAGEPIGARRWTDEQKRRIRDSRRGSTRLLAETLAALDDGPRVLVCASGADYYGDRGDEPLTEDSGPGTSFLAQVCVDWEAAADAARQAGVRVAHLRTGLVLAREAPAMKRLLPLFKAGLGGRFGSGRQYWPWISIADTVGLYRFAIEADSMAGPVNAVAPETVTNAEFTRTVARVLRRPAIVPVPRFGPKLVLGELADTLLFSSKRVLAERAQAQGYAFRHPHLEEAVRQVLSRSTPA